VWRGQPCSQAEWDVRKIRAFRLRQLRMTDFLTAIEMVWNEGERQGRMRRRRSLEKIERDGEMERLQLTK
jgi:hypothetical protein